MRFPNFSEPPSVSSTLPFGTGDASYQAAGGIDGLRRLVDDFYRLMDELPDAADLRRMHPENLEQSRDKLTCFLGGWLGGPRLFSEKYGSISIPSFHAQWPIDEARSTAWLGCMERAIALQPFSLEFAEYLLTQLRVPAHRVVQASRTRHG
ncbi:group II truncated hemoglobin [Pseudomonas aeruginosa]|uniref:group II truncated hemoglobin n=1 Tax=Pseudomonas aeruginosa TaxID=287 RepID=UPI0008775994